MNTNFLTFSFRSRFRFLVCMKSNVLHARSLDALEIGTLNIRKAIFCNIGNTFSCFQSFMLLELYASRAVTPKSSYCFLGFRF